MPSNSTSERTLRVGMVGGGDQRLLEVTPGEHGHVLVQHVPQVVHPAPAYLREGGGSLGVIDQGEHSLLVCRIHAHSEDQGSRKLGNRVKPPSTKIV